MTRGGPRPGAGRPRGDRTTRAYGIRPTSGTLARAAAEGQTIAQRVDLALALLDQLEDAPCLTGPAGERLEDALRCAVGCEQIVRLLEDARSHRQLTPTEHEIWRWAVGDPGELTEQEVLQVLRGARGLRRAARR